MSTAYFLGAFLTFLAAIVILEVIPEYDEYDSLAIAMVVSVAWPFAFIVIGLVAALLATIAVARMVQRGTLSIIRRFM
jgi:hypothetical protein